jgi:hypothetical protein
MQLSLFPVPTPVASSHYYLDHFRSALEWLRSSYRDLLSASERIFIEEFVAVPRCSQALLTRLLMRKGPLFRASKVRYAEIGDITTALTPLVERQWIDLRPQLKIEELVSLLRAPELRDRFPEVHGAGTKAQALALLRSRYRESRAFDEWCVGAGDCVYRLQIAPLCTQLRLLFFGNFHQDWTEFVLVDLGITQYETVRLSRRSRPFASREDVEDFFALYECQRALDEEQSLPVVRACLPRRRLRRGWLETRRSKLLYEMGRRHEAAGEHPSALTLYRQSRHPEARLRAIRVLEVQQRLAAAHAAVCSTLHKPHSAIEAQRLPRVLGRLERRLGLTASARASTAQPPRLDLCLPALQGEASIEQAAREHLAEPQAPVFYVENRLITSLFGLLCWDAIFAPVRGAFFHAFQSSPMDLFTPQFVQRRRQIFDRCLRWLESGAYRAVITEHLRLKHALQSPFVSWGTVSEELVELALRCIPATHLRCYFDRLLADLAENRSGLPDLVQFWVQERRYRMIEVKAPGDRLQDNQRRWIEYCVQHELPVAVCRVRWAA